VVIHGTSVNETKTKGSAKTQARVEENASGAPCLEIMVREVQSTPYRKTIQEAVAISYPFARKK
jgi:hypothetical protein